MTHTENKTEQQFGKKLALAAGSLAVLYTLPQVTEAAIVYKSSPVSGAWDVDGNGSTDFTFGMAMAGIPGHFNGSLSLISSANGRGFVNNVATNNPYIFNLPMSNWVGNTVKAGYFWGPQGGNHRLLTFQSSTNTTNGAFIGGAVSPLGGLVAGLNHIGFRFSPNNDSNVLFGWAELNIHTGARPINTTVTIDSWAYNDTPNAQIHVPEPSIASLALLGMGAGGVRAWRRRKQAALKAAA